MQKLLQNIQHTKHGVQPRSNLPHRCVIGVREFVVESRDEEEIIGLSGRSGRNVVYLLETGRRDRRVATRVDLAIRQSSSRTGK